MHATGGYYLMNIAVSPLEKNPEDKGQCAERIFLPLLLLFTNAHTY
jgi:hypothetical protein